MFKNDPQAVMTGKVRLSYAHLTAPHASQPGQEPKYSATLLIPKSDTATKSEIDAAVRATIQAGITGIWGGIQPPSPKVTLYDGDGVTQNGLPFKEECLGCWVLRASSKQKPGVIDTSLSEILDAGQIYSGMYARVVIRFYPYKNSSGLGVGCSINNVMKVADGEPLAGRSDAKSDFAEVAREYATATPAYGSTTPATPGAYGYAPASVLGYGAIDPLTGLPR